MDAMTIPDVWSGQDRALTVADMPDDEFRYEVDDGVLIVSPAPFTLYQLAVTRLAVILSAQAAVAVFTTAYGDWTDNSTEDFGTLMQRSLAEFR